MPIERNPLIYISPRNFVSALRALRTRPPGKRIGSAALTALSNHVRKNVLHDFQALGLIGRGGIPEEELEQLVRCVDGPDWPEAIGSFVRDRWDLDKRGMPDPIAIAASYGGDPRLVDRTLKFLAQLKRAGLDGLSEASRRRPAAAERQMADRADTVATIAPKPLIQIANGVVLLDAAALASMSDEETLRLASLLKAFARLACGGLDGFDAHAHAAADPDFSRP